MAEFHFTTDTLRPKIKAFTPAMDRAIGTLMQRESGKVQDYARTNAKWQDQTGNARQGLFAKYDKGGKTHTINLYHTVPYGIWLEVRWAGKYAILVPTIQAEGKRIMGNVNKLLGMMA
jgi:hypothetical protein